MTRPADLAIWGRVPPPLGGMSVHIERLLPALHAGGISTQMYSVGRPTLPHASVQQVSDRKVRWLLSRFGRAGEPVHYVFSDDTRARFAASCLAAFGGRAVILRVGGKTVERALQSGSSLERWMIRFAIREATAVVGVSEDICDLVRSLGAREVHHIPGFIPPVEDDTLPPNGVLDFLAGGEGPVALGAGEVWDPSEPDLYGAYAFLDLLEALPSLRAVYFAYEISPLGDSPRATWLKEIGERGLRDRICAYSSSDPLWPTMRKVDLMVRPSLSDGDSNAVREALSLGLPVVASDCVARPSPTIVYPTGDTSAMISVVRATLDRLDEARFEAGIANIPDNTTPIVELVRSLRDRVGRR